MQHCFLLDRIESSLECLCTSGLLSPEKREIHMTCNWSTPHSQFELDMHDPNLPVGALTMTYSTTDGTHVKLFWSRWREAAIWGWVSCETRILRNMYVPFWDVIRVPTMGSWKVMILTGSLLWHSVRHCKPFERAVMIRLGLGDNGELHCVCIGSLDLWCKGFW